MGKADLNANEAWKKLIEKYNILDEVKENGYIAISADQIREFKEPRLMAKWDSNDSLPQSLKEHDLNVLPNSRGTYLVGDFLLYMRIPELDEKVYKMDYVELPEFESIDINNITSEANAINVLQLTHILSDFLETNEYYPTFNGRMGTGQFDFKIQTLKHGTVNVEVQNAQCEIDGGFENAESIVILEAKNVIHEDFNIRQLYYPFRLWKERVNKPIRLVFSIYSNMIFRLFEYRFKDPYDYSSIELIKSKNYSLQDTAIELDDIKRVRASIVEYMDDDQLNTDIPFVQANSMERVISLMENLYDNPRTEQQISELLEFTERQSGYYYNAGKYLGLFTKERIDKQQYVKLTDDAMSLCKMDYKRRQLELVKRILRHRIFAEMFDFTIENGELPEIEIIRRRMLELNVCSENLIQRRSSSIYGWLKWIINLTNL